MTGGKMEKTVRFWPVEVPGKGWSVAMVTGTKKTGRTVERIAGLCDAYTMHQAQMVADSMRRDYLRHGGV